MTRNEIGSEFWSGCTPLDGKGFDLNLGTSDRMYLTLSGRTALEIIIEDILTTRKVSTAYLPSYCCHTMIEPFLKHNINVLFYSVFFNGQRLCYDFEQDNKCEIIFFIDYFGCTDNNILELAKIQKRKDKILIYDDTHSLFSKKVTDIFDYVFFSFRKWMDVNVGCCIKATSFNKKIEVEVFEKYLSLRNDAFDRKASFIQGFIDHKDFLQNFIFAESILETNYHHKGPDKSSLQKINKLNVPYLYNRRRSNFLSLSEGLSDLSKFGIFPLFSTLSINDCPLFFPIIVSDNKRDKLRNFLIENKIYCPVHWPLSSIHTINDESKEIFNNELSIICDQRYEISDMKFIVNKIKEFLYN